MNEREPGEVTAINGGPVADLRNPQVPATLEEIAALRGGALEVIQARVLVLETMRKAAIRATYPEDWVLYKDRRGAIVAYLEDAGGDRVRDVYGIEIFNVSEPLKIADQNGNGFMYLVSGDGRCSVTRQTVERMEGGRSSTEDFCKDKTGAQLEIAVRKAARANLDGGITRELAGLKSVPISELDAAWTGTRKNSKQCREGRGFGSSAERLGAEVETAAGTGTVEIPTCSTCGMPMRLKPAGKTKDGRAFAAFWSCTAYPRCKGTLRDADWQKKREIAKREADIAAADEKQAVEAASGEESPEGTR